MEVFRLIDIIEEGQFRPLPRNKAALLEELKARGRVGAGEDADEQVFLKKRRRDAGMASSSVSSEADSLSVAKIAASKRLRSDFCECEGRRGL